MLTALLAAMSTFFVPSLSNDDLAKLVAQFLAQHPPVYDVAFAAPTHDWGYAALAKAGVISARWMWQSCAGDWQPAYFPTESTRKTIAGHGWKPWTVESTDVQQLLGFDIPLGSYEYVADSATAKPSQARLDSDYGSYFSDPHTVSFYYRLNANANVAYLLSLAPGSDWNVAGNSEVSYSWNPTATLVGSTYPHARRSAEILVAHGAAGWSDVRPWRQIKTVSCDPFFPLPPSPSASPP